jgi:hypothetical protein
MIEEEPSLKYKGLSSNPKINIGHRNYVVSRIDIIKKETSSMIGQATQQQSSVLSRPGNFFGGPVKPSMDFNSSGRPNSIANVYRTPTKPTNQEVTNEERNIESENRTDKKSAIPLRQPSPRSRRSLSSHLMQKANDSMDEHMRNSREFGKITEKGDIGLNTDGPKDRERNANIFSSTPLKVISTKQIPTQFVLRQSGTFSSPSSKIIVKNPSLGKLPNGSKIIQTEKLSEKLEKENFEKDLFEKDDEGNEDITYSFVSPKFKSSKEEPKKNSIEPPVEKKENRPASPFLFQRVPLYIDSLNNEQEEIKSQEQNIPKRVDYASADNFHIDSDQKSAGPVRGNIRFRGQKANAGAFDNNEDINLKRPTSKTDREIKFFASVGQENLGSSNKIQSSKEDTSYESLFTNKKLNSVLRQSLFKEDKEPNEEIKPKKQSNQSTDPFGIYSENQDLTSYQKKKTNTEEPIRSSSAV